MTLPASQSPSADIRTFRAANTRAALAAIRAALGSEAIILQTREVPRLFGRTEIEVTAARGGMAASLAGKRGRAPDIEEEDVTIDDVVEPEPPRRRTLKTMTPRRSGVFRQMVARGVDEELAAGLVERALRHGAGSSESDLLAEVQRLVREHLRPAPVPWQAARPAEGARGRRVMALVGPTGVGKTTTLAKITARALLESHLKVALITVDTYRLGASDQLARYGKIMGVRAHIARDAAGLAAAAAQSADADLILIDTAGRSDRAARMTQTDLLRSLPDIEFHLVLSAATGAREIASMARRYEELEPDHLIFSKLDEADGPGSVLSAASILSRSVSCITDGQRVPEDIHPVTARILTTLVFAARQGAEGDAWTKPTASDS